MTTTHRSSRTDRIHLLFPILLIASIVQGVSLWAQQMVPAIPDPARQWSSYRGYEAGGVYNQAGLPESWNVPEKVNVAWETALPGLGLSCPVIWGDRVFITTAVSETDKSGLKTGIFGDVEPVTDNDRHEWKVYCMDRMSGHILWEKTACTGIPKVKRHPKSTHANATAATDGKHVVAFFGSEGLYCFDMDGALLWEKDFGLLRSSFFAAPEAEWEFASSPVLFENKVIIQCDVLGESFLAALDADTGKEIWRVAREDYPGWSTPNIYRNGDKPFVVVNGYKHMGGYDADTGMEIWRMSGGGDIPIPTPVIGKFIYLNSAHGPKAPIIAVKKDATGDITLSGDNTSGDFVAWSLPRAAPYMQTMILDQDLLYCCEWNGAITCYDALTGERVYRNKLGSMESFTASPVIADGKLYISNDDGLVYVVRTGREFALLGRYPLGDVCMTSPAITGGMMIFRTQHKLVAVAKK